jgi:hypothetical protein
MREIKYTTRFQRDYKREKSGRHGKKLDTLPREVVNLLAADTPLPPGISIIHYPANGRITVIVTSGRISFSSTASRIRTTSNLCALARTVSLECEALGFPT